jgi:bifunctional DNA-binding transcriptional regulator/antitoxin component of YhaV-PrlF toxin-antitoxin module
MESAVTRRGQTVVPAKLRKRYHIVQGDRLVWLDEGGVIRVVPVPANPLNSLRGSIKGAGLLEALLESRRKDRERE